MHLVKRNYFFIDEFKLGRSFRVNSDCDSDVSSLVNKGIGKLLNEAWIIGTRWEPKLSCLFYDNKVKIVVFTELNPFCPIFNKGYDETNYKPDGDNLDLYKDVISHIIHSCCLVRNMSRIINKDISDRIEHVG